MAMTMDSIRQAETWYDNACLGEVLRDEFRKGRFTPIPMDKLTDEQFTLLTVDMNLSDMAMAEIFETTTHFVKKRRDALKIPRGWDNLNMWFDSGRGPVDFKVLLKEISA